METTKQLGIYGCSGHGRVLADIAKAIGVTQVVWIDDDPAVKGTIDFQSFTRKHHDIPVALGIGDNVTRKRISNKLRESGIKIATLIHPSAIISDSANIGEGCVIMPLCVINAGAIVGEGSIVNTGAVIEHDCILGAYSHISPNVSLAGNVKVGEFSHLGIGSCCIQNQVIGTHVLVAAGSCVISNIPDNVMVAGVPAVIKKRHGHE